MRTIYLAIGAAALLYFLALLIYTGPGSSFIYFWLAVALVAGLCWLYLRLMQRRNRRMPRWLRNALVSLVLVVALAFGYVQYRIVEVARSAPAVGLESVIVLGAQVYPGPRASVILEERLMRAAAYLDTSPTSLVVTSGGQGPDEPLPEGRFMGDWLEDVGIAPARILRETTSRNSEENLRFSRQLLEREGRTTLRVGIVSSDYHCLRALRLAEAQGYVDPQPIAARSDRLLLVHNVVREFFAIIKDLIVGNLDAI